jgi:uncharacterized protein (DUF1015 family)
MALIKPFRAWHYNAILKENLDVLTAPLSESKLQQLQKAFYKLPYHYYHISSPLDVPPFENAHRRITNWKLDKVIVQDMIPAFYVYYQHCVFPKTSKTFTRKGLIAMIWAYSFEERVVLPHEKTFASVVDFRTQLLQHTQMQTIPTHGFYTDEAQQMESFWEESMSNPLHDFKDKHHTQHQLSVIQDKKVLDKCVQTLADKQIWLADGHHRYESSVKYRQYQQAVHPQYSEQADYNYHLIWLTNTASSDAGIHPTHRIVHSLKNFHAQDFLQKLSAYFVIESYEAPENKEINKEVTLAKEPAFTFILVFADGSFKIQLKDKTLQHFQKDLPDVIKKLDISVLHYYILEKALDLSEEKQLNHLDFSHLSDFCLKEVREGKAQFAILTKTITLDEIEVICQNAYTMPPKATYFFPKVLGGLVFAEG